MSLFNFAKSGLCLLLAVLPFQSLAQSSWLLPTDIQSKAEKQAPTTRSGWALPALAPVKLSASGSQSAVPAPRPVQPLFTYGSVVTTGFSGTIARMPRWPADAARPDLEDPRYRFIDLNGASATLTAMNGIGFAMNGAELTRLPFDRLLARDIGQVFGVAIDHAEQRNLYLTASSAYGLNITAPDDNSDGLRERLYTGRQNADWMIGQWGADIAAGPGTIWKVDGASGQISVFANVVIDGVHNAGAGLGNIAFDALHDQLFVSDLQSGMIVRLDLAGRLLEQFDHAVLSGQGDAFDPLGVMDITSPDFDVEDERTWGLAPEERRVWGLTAQGGRLYYAVADGLGIYSVGLDRTTGAFDGVPRFEFAVPRRFGRAEISDMAFAGDGALVLAQRGARIGAYDYTTLTRTGQGHVLRFVKERNAQTGALEWVQEPRQVPVGFEPGAAQGAGGVALGPAYDLDGTWMEAHCGGTLWNTGETLRQNPALQGALDAGGNALVDGVQAQSAVLGRTGNAPPWQSYFVDFDRRYDSAEHAGHMGDVEVAGCRGAGGLAEHYASFDETGGGDDPDTPDCQKTPWLCPPPKPACMGVTGAAVCNPATGTYELIADVTDAFGFGIDRYKASSPTGTLAGLPADNSTAQQLIETLTGLVAGQTAQVALCGYSSALKSTGAPFPCCNADLVVTIPDEICEKESN